MKILVFVILILHLLVVPLLTACNGASMLDAVGQDVILYPQIESTLDFSEVQKAVEQKVGMRNFCRQFDITQYKTYQSISYVVCKTTDGPYLILFDSTDPDCTTDCTMARLIFSPIDNQHAIGNLQPGMLYDQVRMADPDGQFDYKFASWGGIIQHSCHCFESGKCYFVIYKGSSIEEVINFTI